MKGGIGLRNIELSLPQKLLELNWGLILLLCMIATFGFAMLYSGSDGSFEPWASRQMVRFGVGLAMLIAVALTDVRVWFRVAYPFYIIALGFLVAVEFTGFVGMGAQRWVDLGVFQLQPSEVMKIAIVLALARYFHSLTMEEVNRFLFLIPPILLVLMPAALVLRQPDLGTALLLMASGAAIFFLAGVRTRFFAVALAAGISAVPIGWQFLREYQKDRILVFLNPESDPLGAGYHIIQSKIALGSGGVFGKGFLLGTQSHLNFLPEKQTDFIFTMLAEELGMIGCLALLGLYLMVIGYGVAIAVQSRNQFGRLMAMGVTTIFFLYVFINIGMVMGLLPIVGVPLPLVSYGGTAMMTLLVGLGLLVSVYIHREVAIPRKYSGED